MNRELGDYADDDEQEQTFDNQDANQDLLENAEAILADYNALIADELAENIEATRDTDPDYNYRGEPRPLDYYFR